MKKKQFCSNAAEHRQRSVVRTGNVHGPAGRMERIWSGNCAGQRRPFAGSGHMVCLAKDGAQASSSLFRKGDFDIRPCSGRSPDPGDRNVFLHGVGANRRRHFDRTSGNRGTAEPGAAGPRDSKLILQRAIFSLGCNGLYALYLGAQGVLGCSAWLLSLSGFYTLLAMMRFCVLLSLRSGQCGWASKYIFRSGPHALPAALCGNRSLCFHLAAINVGNFRLSGKRTSAPHESTDRYRCVSVCIGAGNSDYF